MSLLLPHLTRAATLDAARSRGALVWGANTGAAGFSAPGGQGVMPPKHMNLTHATELSGGPIYARPLP